MKDAHLTLRLPGDLARLLARSARARGVPKSQIAREAVARFVGAKSGAAGPAGLTARELADHWRTLPHLTPAEAASMARDIEAGRRALPAVPSPWE